MVKRLTMIEDKTHWAGKFFVVWTGQAFSLVGSALVQFALVWWLTKETGSATILATSTLIAMLPQIFLGPFAGTFIDRWNRKAVMLVSDSLIAIATLFLIYLFSTGRESIFAIFMILLIRSAGGAFHYPAMQASTSLMVPKQHLARIAGMNQTLYGVISVFAPPLGALLISIFPLHSVLYVDVFTAIIAVTLLTLVAIPQPIKKNGIGDGTLKPNTYMQDLKEGWRYMVKWPGLLSLALLAMFLNFLLTPSASLIPLMVTKIYHGGAVQLGLVDSSVGVGVILGGLILSVWGGFKKKILTSVMGIVGMGIGIIVFGSLPGDQFYLALGACFFLGLMQVLANGPLSAIFQATIDPAMQGRVLSLIGAGATAMSPISLLVAGPVADNLGLRTWYIVGGIISVIAALSAYFIPAIMGIEDNHPDTVPSESTIPLEQ